METSLVSVFRFDGNLPETSAQIYFFKYLHASEGVDIYI